MILPWTYSRNLPVNETVILQRSFGWFKQDLAMLLTLPFKITFKIMHEYDVQYLCTIIYMHILSKSWIL